MRQTELHLSQEDRSVIEGIRGKGMHQAREVNRAHVLSCLDRGIPESQIMAVLGIGRTAVWRARAAYLQGGVDLAVFDVERSGRPRQYDTPLLPVVQIINGLPDGAALVGLARICARARMSFRSSSHCVNGDRSCASL